MAYPRLTIAALGGVAAVGLVAWLWMHQGARRASPSSAPDAAPSPADAATDAPPAAGAQDALLAKSRAQFTRLEQRFNVQQPDDAWAGPYRAQLMDRFRAAQLDAIATLGAVECRRTLCRIDLRFRATAQLAADEAQLITAWLVPLAPCSYHIPGPLLLDDSPDARLFVECRR